MPAGVLESILVRATLASERQLQATRAAAAAGDESWREWLAEHARGDALLLALHVCAEFRVGDRSGRVALVNDGVWAENDVHPPTVEEQVRELFFKDVSLLSATLSEHGVGVDDEEISRMYVRIELAPPVRAALGPPSVPGRTGPAIGPGVEGWAEA